MGGQSRSIKFKILTLVLVPLVSLIGIWTFAATITTQDGLRLLRIRTVYDNVINPARAVTANIQQERYLSLLYLGSSSSDRGELDEQRARTDRSRAAFERLALTDDVRAITSPPLLAAVTDFVTVTRRLPDIRARVDTRSFTRMLALDAYRLMSDAVTRIYDKNQISDDPSLSEPTRALTLLARSRELMNEQAGLLAAVVGLGAMTAEEKTFFTSTVTKRRLLYDMGYQLLDTELRKPYITLQSTPAYTRYASIEDSVNYEVKPGRPLPGSSATWGSTIQSLNITFDRQAGIAAQQVADRAESLAGRTLWQVGTVALLGLLGIGLSLYVSVRFGRRITAELVDLQRAALELAHHRLPEVVRRLRRGEDVDVAAETPPITTSGTAEIENVGRAFTSVQSTAIEAAVGQAEIRKGVGKVFLNLARRNQSLLHRQLTMLDSLEQRVTEPDLLEDLFGIDHLTTRMRRHAEGLIIMSGAVPGRGWRHPVPLYDVVRAAVEEVEDYLRVHITIPEDTALNGAATTDVIHLLAELVENATIFSPPHTHVEVRGEAVARGFVIEIEDRGLGLSQEEAAEINHRLSEPPEFDLADSDRLGLFVVGRLAARRGIRVSLRNSPYGGTTAIVLIPDDLVTPIPAGGTQNGQYLVEQITALEPGAGDGPRQAGGEAYVPAHRAPAEAASGGFSESETLTIGDDDGPERKRRAGLPQRVRQASLAPQLRESAQRAAAERRTAASLEERQAEEPQPSPDVFSSFRAGWQRARDGQGDVS
ncbi:nitrate- and nitrite sensing domain-containing protein [Sphaerisporangium rubeum]|uniref:histidine kinase n=1 Tax=Sphaerisporangium rubeum TaxID=321317 RepID=A0A7X0M4B2_9ACTN|nr:nitrate- and nitrite sensing domain-containing protein [Sphaerisporangium rubeum]MBB6471468.1 signal transduction histidine kinase [Sphaerisporangium rubeum]